MVATPDDNSKKIAQAIAKFAANITDGKILTVSDAGLMAYSSEYGFRRLMDNMAIPDSPIYIGIRLPSIVNIKEGLGEKALEAIEKNLRTQHVGLRLYARGHGTSIKSQFDPVLDGDTVYINVQPIIEAPEAATKYFSISSRRNALFTIRSALAGLLGIDSYRRLTDDESGITNKIIGGLEGTGAAYFGSKVAKTGISRVLKNHPLLSCDPIDAETRWQTFLENMSTQIGVSRHH